MEEARAAAVGKGAIRAGGVLGTAEGAVAKIADVGFRIGFLQIVAEETEAMGGPIDGIKVAMGPGGQRVQ